MDEKLIALLRSRGYNPEKAYLSKDEQTLYIEVEVRLWRWTSTCGVRVTKVREWNGGLMPVEMLFLDEIVRELKDRLVITDDGLRRAPETDREKELLNELYWRERGAIDTQRWDSKERWPILGRKHIP